MIPFALDAPLVMLDTPVSSDADAVFAHCQDPLFEKVLNTPWPYTHAHASHFVDTFVPTGWASGAELTWALRRGPRHPLLGVVSLRRPGDGRSSLGFWLGAEHRGEGLMPAAVSAVVDWAFAHDLVAVEWECVEGNVASMRVVQKLGFTFTGTGAADLPSRDGTRPTAWKGVLVATDARVPSDGWPA